MDVAPQRLVTRRKPEISSITKISRKYCSAKQLIKAIQVHRENLEVINCTQLQLSDSQLVSLDERTNAIRHNCAMRSYPMKTLFVDQ
ncbi:hypothetical protein T4B_11971 [Trichinella pseudospiralis]|uniref:Uncharacterized protein n=1 Tax=Trichinella pseudospiralis TaxID=6337 RepID=A0A0V1HEQ9_TRIPS|nr:hypothetical protein T4B_11971 [Trichinella pseudospiralis]